MFQKYFVELHSVIIHFLLSVTVLYYSNDDYKNNFASPKLFYSMILRLIIQLNMTD